MKSHITEKFRILMAQLPEKIRKQAKTAYAQFQRDPYHPGLRFKRVHSKMPIFSVRITKDYRAVGIQKDGEMIWFWIGSHGDYEKLLRQIRQH